MDMSETLFISFLRNNYRLIFDISLVFGGMIVGYFTAKILEVRKDIKEHNK